MVISTVRKAVESQYKGLCTISEYKPVKDPITHQTRHEEVIVLAEQACRLSFETIKSVTAESIATTAQTVKLFIAPEIDIKPGSKITVTQNGHTEVYCRSGIPSFYSSHQEIMLEPFEGWA